MKKSGNQNYFLTLTAGLIASCSSSDNPTATPSSTFTADATNFQGDITR
jgi:hypothetical protein